MTLVEGHAYGRPANNADLSCISRSSVMTDHDHGLGLSGLRRIRQQHNPIRAPTLPSPSSRTPSLGALTRTSSLTMMELHGQPVPLSPGPSSPTFTEDLSRFPSESLHSFSFANQSEDLIHSRQNVLKRSIEFMKDRMGWSAASSAGIASAQARVTGDVEMQNMLDLLAKAQLVGAGNLPNGDPTMPLGPLSGPAMISGENVFDKQFVPRTASPDPIERTPMLSSTDSIVKQTQRDEGKDRAAPRLDSQPQGLDEEGESENSSRTPTNESGTTAQPSPPSSRRPSGLKRTMTDTVQVSMHQKLMDVMANPFLAVEPLNQAKPSTSAPAQAFSPPVIPPSAVPSAVHGHATRWVPAAQAIFTTEAKPPWTIIAANDLACLLFGVTKAEVRKMGILEVVQEERRGWLEKKLQKGSPGDAGDGSESEISQPSPAVQTSNLLGSRGGGITAKLLSKPNSRSQTPKNGRRPATVHSGDPKPPKPGLTHHNSNKSRGVLLCGDVVPIQVMLVLHASFDQTHCLANHGTNRNGTELPDLQVCGSRRRRWA